MHNVIFDILCTSREDLEREDLPVPLDLLDLE